MIDELNNTQDNQNNQNNQNRQNKKGKRLKIILAAGLCVGLAAVSSFALLANASDNNNNNNIAASQNNSAVISGSNNNTDSKAGMKKGMCGMDMGMGRDFFNLSDVATFLGITQDELQTKLDAANGNIVQVLNDAGKLEEFKTKILTDLKTKLDAAVTAGKMTQSQADTVYASAQAMADSITSSSDINVNSGFKGKDGDMKFGMGMKMGDIDVTALLGITQDELNTKLQAANGNLYKVLGDAGKLDAYKAQLLANVKTKLDSAVAAGKMTQADADKEYAGEQTEINSITADTPMPSFGGGECKMGGRTDMGMGCMDCMGGYDMATAASVMGITQDELKTQVQAANGNLFKVLEDAGKMDAYKAQVLANCKTKLDAAVAAGKMTQADADAAYAKMQTTVNSFSSANAPSMNFKGGQRGSRNGNKSGQSSANNPDSGITPFVPGNYQTNQNTAPATATDTVNQGI